MSSREMYSSSRKTVRQNSQKANSTILQIINQQQLSSLRQESELDQPVSFYNEISDIMRGFGDSEQPLRESVLLVEKIVQQQLRGILNEASSVAAFRERANGPTQADFEFLMRKHPAKINRMRKHFKDMKLLKRFLAVQTGRPQVLADLDSNQESEDEIDLEIPEKYDDEKTRRLFRADRISQILTGEQYQKYNEARKTSFHCRQSKKMKTYFKSFLGLGEDLKLSNSAINVLTYLAHETIAAIVDYAILTRLNSLNRKTDPYSRITSSGSSYSMLHLCPEVTQGRGLDGVKPITVQEIQEAIRRFNQFSLNRGRGFYRNCIDKSVRQCYLAL